jgi:phage baseplate assembly protein W
MADTGLPNTAALPEDSNTFFAEANAIWPGLQSGQALISPARNGMNRQTGQMMQGWDHVQQSMELIFATPFHQRVLRRWVGSFVPHILGESAVARIVTRFFWAIVTAIDLWEPDYRIQQTYMMGAALQNWSPADASSVDQLLRQGQAIFRTEGMYYPRGHLGDFTPYIQQSSGLVSNGQYFNVVPVTGSPVVVSAAAAAANAATA